MAKYLTKCSMNLNPATQPIKVLKLVGELFISSSLVTKKLFFAGFAFISKNHTVTPKISFWMKYDFACTVKAVTFCMYSNPKYLLLKQPFIIYY